MTYIKTINYKFTAKKNKKFTFLFNFGNFLGVYSFTNFYYNYLLTPLSSNILNSMNLINLQDLSVSVLSRGFVSVKIVQLILDGIYYRVKYYKSYNILGFILGFNHYIMYKLPDFVYAKVNMRRRKFLLYSYDLTSLMNIAHEIVNLKYPNTYKGKGVRLMGRTYHRKNIVKKGR